MKAFGRVVVATDFSPASRATIAAVEALAGTDDIVLHVVHVLEPVSYALPPTTLLDYERERREEARDQLDQVAAAVAKRIGGGVRTHMLEGPPATQICRLAEQVRAHLVIVGSHGRTGLRRAVIGSVAERVARHAGRPVLIVPGAGSHRRRR
jgi:nucleotide-binding universal stress UspA family protein